MGGTTPPQSGLGARGGYSHSRRFGKEARSIFGCLEERPDGEREFDIEQAGLKIGNACWELYCFEHDILPATTSAQSPQRLIQYNVICSFGLSRDGCLDRNVQRFYAGG